jgi:hypothetical protein
MIWGVNVASGADTPSTFLDRQWESLMLKGKSFFLADGVQLNSGGTPYQTYKGQLMRSTFQTEASGWRIYVKLVSEAC